jgi:hypothetical protein
MHFSVRAVYEWNNSNSNNNIEKLWCKISDEYDGVTKRQQQDPIVNSKAMVCIM